MSYGRMASREQELGRQLASWLEQAGEVDEQEEQRYGKHRGDEMPAWVADQQKRLERIREARLALEAEAKEQAQALQEASGPPRKGRPGKAPAEEPKASTQRNFVDPQSRIMKSKDGFIQGYNAQVAVDADHQVIVAQGVTQSGSDAGQLQPMVEQVEQGCGHAGVVCRQGLLFRKELLAREGDSGVCGGRSSEVSGHWQEYSLRTD